jgi:hypothetical protein
MENSVDYMDTNICPKCAGDVQGEVCDFCGYSSSNGQKCPTCGFADLYDAEAVFCHNCGYTGLESVYGPIPTADGEELLDAVDLVESHEAAYKSVAYSYAPSDWADAMLATAKDTVNGKPWPFGVYKVEPYQPFFNLIEDLKKWKVTVRKTDDKGRLHTWVNKMASKGAGCDTTHMGKAFGPYVWIPESQWGTKQGYCTLVHEATHAKDFWKFGTIFFFLMQNLLPFGPSFVALFEYRAYVAGLKAEKLAFGSLLPRATERVAEALASRGYRYCFPFPKLMKKLLDNAIGE